MEVEEDFAGAGGAARDIQEPTPEFSCDFCHSLFAFQSDIARCEVHGDEICMHQRADTVRILVAACTVAKDVSYTGVTRVSDICYRCFGRKAHGDENKYVTLDAEGDTINTKRVWKRMADQSKNVPGPSTAAKHLSRVQARAGQMKDAFPEKAQCFATLTDLIHEKAQARGNDWCFLG